MSKHREGRVPPHPGPLTDKEYAVLLALSLGGGVWVNHDGKTEPFIYVGGEDVSEVWMELWRRGLVDWANVPADDPRVQIPEVRPIGTATLEGWVRPDVKWTYSGNERWS